jgi:hypothetical protein
MSALATIAQSLAITDNARPVQLGKIKIGMKGEKRSGERGDWYLPKKLDHFLITTLQRGEGENFILDQELMDSLPKDEDGKIRRLPIALLSNDLDEIVRRRHLWYLGQRKAGESDGKKLTLWYSPKKPHNLLDKPLVIDWTCSEDEENLDVAKLVNEERVFKKHTTFNCMIRSPHARFGGVYQLRSVGEINWDQIYNSIANIKELTGGFLRFLPLELVIRPTQVCPLVKGVPAPSVVYVVHVEVKGFTLDGIRQLAYEQMTREIDDARKIRQFQVQYQKLVRSLTFREADIEPEDLADERVLELPVSPPPPPVFQVQGQTGPVDSRSFGPEGDRGVEPGGTEVVPPTESLPPVKPKADPLNNSIDFDNLLKAKKKDRVSAFCWLNAWIKAEEDHPPYHVASKWPEGVYVEHRRVLVDVLNGKTPEPAAKAGA